MTLIKLRKLLLIINYNATATAAGDHGALQEGAEKPEKCLH